MSTLSKIQWTDRTWNPVRGCSIVSPGCVNCYAMKQAHRFGGTAAYAGLTKMTSAGPQWTGEVSLVDEALDEPDHWKKPCRVFVNSMSDLFHKDVPLWFVEHVFLTMRRNSQHTFQILTKRPERMLAVLKQTILWNELPLGNVWLGVSAENQEWFDARMPILKRVPAIVHFASLEPLLGPIDITGQVYGNFPHWLIVGGESGPGARDCHLEWIRTIVRNATTLGVTCFVKQLGARPVLEKEVYDGNVTRTRYMRVVDRKGGSPVEWPEDLRVREFPR